jgi:hypothetical protein
MNENILIELLAGGFGGFSAVLAGHSLDTLKVRIQTLPQSEIKTNVYKFTFNYLKTIVKNEVQKSSSFFF